MMQPIKETKDHDAARKAELLDDEGVTKLASAIIEAACNDYLKAKKRVTFGKIAKRREEARWELEDIVRFFRGKWFGILCDLDPDIILAELDVQFEQYAKSRLEQKQ